MIEEETCWICRRSIDDITKEMAVESEEQKKLKLQMKSVEEESNKFLEQTNIWISHGSNVFDQLNYDFLLENPKQFGAVPFLFELDSVGKTIVKDFTECKYRASRGDMFGLGKIDSDESVKSESRKVVLQKITDFEKSAATLSKGKLFEYDYLSEHFQYPKGYLTNFQGLKFKEGVMFLQKIGMLYYQIQVDLPKNNFSNASSKISTWKIDKVKLKNYPTVVRICNVCDNLISRYSEYR